MCPKKLSEIKSPKRGVVKVGGKKIEFNLIIQQINQSHLYWGVSEVHKDLVKGKVTRFRTLKLLEKGSKDGKLDMVSENGTYYFGPKLNQPQPPQ